MNKDYEKCLKNGRIVKQAYAENLIPAELTAARNDVASARRSLKEDNDKWVTIQAYYCIFHTARALLFQKGYREKSHYCLKAAIQVLYVDDGILEQEYLDDFDTTMLLRETADDKSDFSRDGSEAAIRSAESFLRRAEELLEIK